MKLVWTYGKSVWNFLKWMWKKCEIGVKKTWSPCEISWNECEKNMNSTRTKRELSLNRSNELNMKIMWNADTIVCGEEHHILLHHSDTSCGIRSKWKYKRCFFCTCPCKACFVRCSSCGFLNNPARVRDNPVHSLNSLCMPSSSWRVLVTSLCVPWNPWCFEKM